jgi:nitroreductase
MCVITQNVAMNTVVNNMVNEKLPVPQELLDITGGSKRPRALGSSDLSTLFCDARTHNQWTDQRVEPTLLKEIYDVMKWAPTAANSSPLRVTFVQSDEAKALLLNAVTPGNHEKVRTAPATAILSYDTHFFEKLDKLAPHMPKPTRFESDAQAAEHSAARNAWLQAGYFIIAARSLGLDCGPVGGIDREKINAEFFADGRNRSFLLVNLGYGNHEVLRPRAARLGFDEACRVL